MKQILSVSFFLSMTLLAVGCSCSTDNDCDTTADCSGTEQCDTTNNVCVECLLDSTCDSAAPECIDNACAMCTADTCDTGETCNATSGVCETNSTACQDSSECTGVNDVCDTAGTEGVCVDCIGTEGCASNQTCEEGATTADNACVDNAVCTSDADCTDGNYDICNTVTGACVATCFNNADGSLAEGCSSSTNLLCNDSSSPDNTCVAGCYNDANGDPVGCSASEVCQIGMNSLPNMCVECYTDMTSGEAVGCNDFGDNKPLCDSNACVACGKSYDINDPATCPASHPVCWTAQMSATNAGACTECDPGQGGSAQCAAPMNVDYWCDFGSSVSDPVDNVCAPCSLEGTNTNGCTVDTMPVCQINAADRSMNTCVACSDDDPCINPSKTCNTNTGACVDPN